LRRGDEAPEPRTDYRFFAAFLVAGFLAAGFLAAAFLAAFFAIRLSLVGDARSVSRHWPITTGGLSYVASHKM
jgi:hypothetical protein